MANIKSQIKRNRQNDKHRLRNRVYRGEARTAIKNARAAFESGNAEVSRTELLRALSALDRAAEKGVLHKNNAARRKSRLMKAFASMKPVEITEQEPAAAAAPVAEPKKKGGRKDKAAKPAAEKPGKTEVKATSAKGKKPAAEKAPAKAKPAAKAKKPAPKKK